MRSNYILLMKGVLPVWAKMWKVVLWLVFIVSNLLQLEAAEKMGNPGATWKKWVIFCRQQAGARIEPKGGESVVRGGSESEERITCPHPFPLTVHPRARAFSASWSRPSDFCILMAVNLRRYMENEKWGKVQCHVFQHFRLVGGGSANSSLLAPPTHPRLQCSNL